jgi:hypothetical protein
MSQHADFRSAMLNQRPGHAAIRRRQKAEDEKAAAAGLPPPASATAESFVLSFAFYLPYNNNQKLMGYGRESVEDVGLENCKKSTGPAYCDDVHVLSQSGLAFLSCDTAKAVWNPPFGIQNDSLVNATPRSGEIWVQDLRAVSPNHRCWISYDLTNIAMSGVLCTKEIGGGRIRRRFSSTWTHFVSRSGF